MPSPCSPGWLVARAEMRRTVLAKGSMARARSSIVDVCIPFFASLQPLHGVGVTTTGAKGGQTGLPLREPRPLTQHDGFLEVATRAGQKKAPRPTPASWTGDFMKRRKSEWVVISCASVQHTGERKTRANARPAPTIVPTGYRWLHWFPGGVQPKRLEK